MKRRLVKIILVVAALSTAIYFLLGKERIIRVINPAVNFGRKEFKEINKDFNKKKEQTAAVFTKISQGVFQKTSEIIDKVKDLVSDSVKEAKVSSLNFLKNTVDEKIDKLGQELNLGTEGLSKDNVIALEKEIISFSVKAGATAYFTIKNSENENLTYEVDWQDKEVSRGFLNKNDKIILGHKWDNKGSYIIEFKIGTPDKEKKYEIPIVIF